MLDFLKQSAEQVAPALLGWRLVSDRGNKRTSGIIVETESYHQDDAASHSFSGETPRNSVMFGPAGHAYVYFTYGMHYCFNIVTGKEGQGEAVLIRALEPVDGIDIMRVRRGRQETIELTNGPAKLCQALGIDKGVNSHDLTLPPLRLEPPTQTLGTIVTAKRVGISKNIDPLWRFYFENNPFVSKK